MSLNGNSDDPKYLKMLAQMGLKPEIVPEEIKQTIMQKLGLAKSSLKQVAQLSADLEYEG